ncbi:MAG: hypothetical protein EA402_05065 [Planctomycetota bacterium]|nr:MAG: hypothetical protein EA402_05065 [Planctomycetota bacterium]
MLGVSFIAGAYNASLRNRQADAKGRFNHLGTMAKAAGQDPDFRKRVEAIDRSIRDQIERGVEGRLACPECGKTMVTVNIEGVELDTCASCKGFWFDDGELAHFTGLREDIANPALKDRASRYQCPVCQETMREVVFKAPFNLLIDRCPNGHGVYCEAKEFEWAMGLGHGQPIKS